MKKWMRNDIREPVKLLLRPGSAWIGGCMVGQCLGLACLVTACVVLIVLVPEPSSCLLPATQQQGRHGQASWARSCRVCAGLIRMFTSVSWHLHVMAASAATVLSTSCCLLLRSVLGAYLNTQPEDLTATSLHSLCSTCVVGTIGSVKMSLHILLSSRNVTL
jgi:hypothetical protein